MLADLQRFVGLDPALAPGELPRENIRWATTHMGVASGQHLECGCSYVDRQPSSLSKLLLRLGRKSKYRADGWPMKRREYEHILSLARPRALQ